MERFADRSIRAKRAGTERGPGVKDETDGLRNEAQQLKRRAPGHSRGASLFWIQPPSTVSPPIQTRATSAGVPVAKAAARARSGLAAWRNTASRGVPGAG